MWVRVLGGLKPIIFDTLMFDVFPTDTQFSVGDLPRIIFINCKRTVGVCKLMTPEINIYLFEKFNFGKIGQTILMAQPFRPKMFFPFFFSQASLVAAFGTENHKSALLRKGIFK